MTKIFSNVEASKIARKGVNAAKASKMIAKGEAFYKEVRGETVLAIRYSDNAYSHNNAVGAQIARAVTYWREVPVA